MRGCDVSLCKGGENCPAAEKPEEVVVRIKGSKTDQYNIGEVRNHWASGDAEGLCPVEALRNLRRHFPQRFEDGPESTPPLFRKADGQLLVRTEVTALLEEAASVDGFEPSMVGSHSLRIGGACAL